MDFLKICRSELDRLIEQSPQIPDNVIRYFEKEFINMPNLKKPDIAHGIDHTKVFKDTDTRIKKMVVEATMMLKQKRKVWHDAMMPDVDRHLEKKISDLSGNFNSVLEDKLRAFEEKIGTRTGIPRALVRGTTSVRKPESLHVTFPNPPRTKVESPSQPIGITISPVLVEDSKPEGAVPNEVVISVASIEQSESDTGDANEYSKKS
jgi:hypothetical protein